MISKYRNLKKKKKNSHVICDIEQVEMLKCLTGKKIYNKKIICIR